MKGVVSFLFVIFASVSAFSAAKEARFFNASICAPLFQRFQVKFDQFLPLESNIEKELRADAKRLQLLTKAEITTFPSGREVEHLPVIDFTKMEGLSKYSKTIREKEIALKQAMYVISDYHASLGRLRKIDPDIDRVQFNSVNFSRESYQRINEVFAAIFYRTAELLAAKGIKYEIGNYDIRIAKYGDHFVNQQVRKFAINSALTVIINPMYLVEYGAGGMYYKGLENILLSPQILLSKSLYQDNVGLHEYTHHKDLKSGPPKDFKPYRERVAVKFVSPEISDQLGIYRKGFSIDEIKAYRTSAKVMLHEVLTSKNEFKIGAFEKYLDSVITFSEISKKVYAKRILDLAGTPQQLMSKNEREVKISENEIYEISRITYEQTKEVYELVDFTHQLFSYLKKKTIEAKSKDTTEQFKIYNQINRVLTLPAIRRMEAPYPSMSEIEGYFQ